MKNRIIAVDYSKYKVSSIWFIFLLIILAASLRLYKLGSQLWSDEISALSGYRRPFLEIVTTFPDYFPHPLYELLAHSSLLIFGENPFSLRFPSAIFGAAGVIALFFLAKRLIGKWEALLASFLFASSYHHIFFSQNARGYTVYLFLALIATSIMLSILQKIRWSNALSYVVIASLAAYSHPFGIFLPLGHMMVAIPWASYKRLKYNESKPKVLYLAGMAILTGVLIVILYSPILREGVTYGFTISRLEGSGPRIYQFLPELLEGLRSALGGWIPIVFGLIVGFIGAIDILRKKPLALCILISPVLIAMIMIGILGMGIHPRYFLLALPISYLICTRGLATIARLFLDENLKLTESHSFKIKFTMSIVLLIFSTYPLLTYYSLPKQDFIGSLQNIKKSASHKDSIVAVSVAGNAIKAYYDNNIHVVYDLSELLQEEQKGNRVWALTTLERLMEKTNAELLTHLRSNYKLMYVLPGSVGDGDVRIYMKEGKSLNSR